MKHHKKQVKWKDRSVEEETIPLDVKYETVQIHRNARLRKWSCTPYYKEIYVKVGLRGIKDCFEENFIARGRVDGLALKQAYLDGKRDRDVFAIFPELRRLNAVMVEHSVGGNNFYQRLHNLIGLNQYCCDDVYMIGDIEVSTQYPDGSITNILQRQMAVDFPGIWICQIRPSQFVAGWSRTWGKYLKVGYAYFTRDFLLAKAKIEERATALGYRSYFDGDYFIGVSSDLLGF